ncbi:MAG: FtsX-like permease family protein [Verrucomicrobiae bacterium]|nr:FtsX-like permease family protein [Verrucomicrobiae bacterium]
MTWPAPLFLALRYLRPRRTFVSVITVISVVGVTLGVMVLILVISVMTGFDLELRQKVLGLNAHLTITGFGPIENWESTLKQVDARPDVRGCAPFVLGPVLAKHHGRVFTPYLKGVDPVREERVSRLPKYLVEGTFDLSKEQVIVGREMARRQGIFVGDRLIIYSPRSLETNREAQLPSSMVVSGIFESGMFEYDYGFVFCSLAAAQDLYDLGDAVHGLAVMTDGLEQVEGVQRDLNKILPSPLRANTWMELNRRLFAAVAVEKNVMFFILFFIIIVAAFGIMSTLITVTVQKHREIGILKALGATPMDVLQVFLAQGVAVGVLGTGFGLGLGLSLLRFRNEFLDFLRKTTGFELFPREVYHFDQLPAATNLRDLLVICGGALLICALAGLLPAWRAASLKPSRAMREI